MIPGGQILDQSFQPELSSFLQFRESRIPITELNNDQPEGKDALTKL